MHTAASPEPTIAKVRVTRSEIIADLSDGRVIRVPLAWSWRLSQATPAQRANFRLIGDGQGVHWPDVEEDISVEGMLHGSPAPRPGAARVGAKVPKPDRAKGAGGTPLRRTAGGGGRR